MDRGDGKGIKLTGLKELRLLLDKAVDSEVFSEIPSEAEEYDLDQGARIAPKQRNEKIYCEDCEHQCWTKLTLKVIEKHLLGYREDGADSRGTRY